MTQPSPYQNDEIDLMELLVKLAKEWKWLVGITLIVSGLVAAYALTKPNDYQLSMVFTQPSEASEQVTDSMRANAMQAALQSAQVRQQVTEIPPASSQFAVAFQAISGKASQDNFEQMTLTLATTTPESAQAYYQALLPLAQPVARDIASTLLQAEQEALNTQLNSIYQQAALAKQAALARLEQARTLAEALDITEPTGPFSQTSQFVGDLGRDQSVDRLYMLGTQGLSIMMAMIENEAPASVAINPNSLLSLVDHAVWVGNVKPSQVSELVAKRAALSEAAPTAPILTLETMQVSQQSNRTLLLIIAGVMLGGMLSLFVVALKLGYKNYQAKQQAV